MKRLLSVLLVITIIFSSFAGLQITTSAADLPASGSCGENVTYTFDSSTGLLTISGSGAIKGYGAGGSPFYNQSSIKTVVINEGVTYLGCWAFHDCKNLTSVTISDSVTSLGGWTFWGCSTLTDVNIPFSEKSLVQTFVGCSSLRNITIPNGVTFIGGAFKGCSSLKSIIMPDSVTSIDKESFIDCSGLESVSIPNSITSIGERAFFGCTSLTQVNYAGTQEEWNTIDIDIDNVPLLAVKPKTVYQCGEYVSGTFDVNTSTLTINGSGAIADYASPFNSHTYIKKLVIKSGVTSIGKYAFYGCSGLTSVSIPDSVTSIGYGAFYGCSGIKELTMPCSAKIYNDEYTFYNCKNIEKVILTKGTGNMQNYTRFSAMSDTFNKYTPWYVSRDNLKELVIEDGITNISRDAFSGCGELTSVTIPNSVTSIGEYAFSGCSGLTGIILPKLISTLEEGTFSYCSSLIDISIPDSVTNICSKAFYECSGLISVTIPNSVTSIGERAFANCKSLTSIVIPVSVSHIGNEVFEGCESLKELTLPNVEDVIVKSYDVYAHSRGSFNNLNLEKINFLDTPDEWVKRYLFNSVKSISFNGVVYKDIELNSEEVCPNTFTCNEDIQKLSLTTNVKSIGNTSFNLCPNLKQITIPYHLESYGFDDLGKQTDEKFKGFYNSPIEKITFCDNPTEITDKFNNLFKLESLKEFEIPESVSYIGDAAFKDCKNLTTVTIPKSVTRIEYNAFSGCTNLTVRGYRDSYAETFCMWAGIPFEAIEEPHNHSFTTTVTQPTCTEQGFTTHSCSCGESYVDSYTPELGHDDLAETVVKPTGTQLGYIEHLCSRCGELQSVDSYTAPTGKLTLKHSARTANAIKVQWNNVKTATGYQVQISTKDGKKWSTSATLKAGVTYYTFKKLAAGNNYKFRVRFYIKAEDGKNYYSPWSKTLGSPTLPSGTTLTKLSSAKKAFNAQWKKNAAVNGYQIQYGLKSNFSGAKTLTVKNAKTLKATVKKLSAKKTYYVRIRTYKTISKVNYFSSWSKAYKVKTK